MNLVPFLTFLTLGTAVLATAAAPDPAMIDDFSDPSTTGRGAGRMTITDTDLGGKSEATPTFADGVLAVEGTLVPARGAPAFVSLPLLLAPAGTAQDVSAFEGVRLRVKVKRGILSVQVSSATIDNFDYHTSAPLTRSPDAFQEVRIPFTEMKRAWSAQTALDLTTITSVNLVSAGMARDAFAYEIDEIGFY